MFVGPLSVRLLVVMIGPMRRILSNYSLPMLQRLTKALSHVLCMSGGVWSMSGGVWWCLMLVWWCPVVSGGGVDVDLYDLN